MRSLVLYLHMHQPYRVKHYSIFAAGHDHDYWTDKDWYAGTNNERIFKKVSEKSYRPMLKLIQKCLNDYLDFKLSLSITGTFLEQAEEFAPDVIELLQNIIATGRVEIAAETYYHSLAFFFNREEFENEVLLHRAKIKALFGVEPKVFRNTEFSYNDDLACWAEQFGLKGILAEGWEKVIGERKPNRVYTPDGCKNIRLLLKNYKLSDDIAFRFSDKNWREWPLTVEKYQKWLDGATVDGGLANIFMDFETFGENVWKDTGIFEFFASFVKKWHEANEHNFLTISEACDSEVPHDKVSMPWTVTWADEERDLSAWLGNSMQHEATNAVYELRDAVLATNDAELISDWRKLLTSDHSYYMCTKYYNDGDVHAYFSPYESPFDAFSYYMNALRDIRARIEKATKKV